MPRHISASSTPLRSARHDSDLPLLGPDRVRPNHHERFPLVLSLHNLLTLIDPLPAVGGSSLNSFPRRSNHPHSDHRGPLSVSRSNYRFARNYLTTARGTELTSRPLPVSDTPTNSRFQIQPHQSYQNLAPVEQLSARNKSSPVHAGVELWSHPFRRDSVFRSAISTISPPFIMMLTLGVLGTNDTRRSSERKHQQPQRIPKSRAPSGGKLR